MVAVQATFYFDFADVRSYLAAVQLPGLVSTLPIRLDLVPVNANALSAFVGAPVRGVEPGAQRYQQLDAERWARRHHLPLRWPSQPLTSGPALRVAMWLVQNAPEHAFDAILGIFRRVWQRGEALGEEVVREVLGAAGLDAQLALQHAARAESFPAFEALVELAVGDGIFEIPTLRIGANDDFVGFDRMDLVSRAVLECVLRTAPAERVATLCANLLAELEPARRDALLAELGQSSQHLELDADEPRNPRFDAVAAAIRTLPTVDATAQLPIPQPAGALLLAVVPSRDHPRPLADAEDLRALLAEDPDHGVVFGPSPMVVSDVPRLAESLAASGLESETGGLLMPVIADGRDALLHLPPVRSARPSVHLRTIYAAIAPDGELLAPVLSRGRIAMLSGGLAFDPAVHRKVARIGAHAIVLCGVSPADPTAIASAVRCRRWIVTIDDERVGLHDREGQFVVRDFPLSEPSLRLELPWPPVLDDPQARTWTVEAPRTLLVHERPVTLGAPDSGADLSFRVAGTSLSVSGGNVTSSLSPTQPFTAVRHGFATVQVVPVFGEQIMAAELVTAKILDALSRRRHSARILLVNYWPELAFAELGRLRPVLAATAREHEAPLLVVTGRRLVELWQSDAQRQVYRVEPDGELFPLDLALQPSMQLRRDRFVQAVDEPEHYLAMLRTMRA